MSETLLIPVYVRALESQRPDALLHDELALALVSERRADFSRVEKIRMDEGDRVALVLRNREFDRQVRDFLGRQRDAVVVHIGCGLDQRFERVDDGRVEWYDLDLPEVIGLRRELLHGAKPRYHLLSSSVFDAAWMDALHVHCERAVLFVAEGVFVYFEPEQARRLVLALRERFPGSELVFDAFSPLLVRVNKLRLRLTRSSMYARYSWGLQRGEDVERWGDGIRLLDEWHLFDRPEPRLRRYRWMRHIRPLAKIMGIFHYQLGDDSE